MALLAFLRALAHYEKVEVSRTSENPGNHSIGPVFFCRVDVLKARSMQKMTAQAPGKGSSWSLCAAKTRLNTRTHERMPAHVTHIDNTVIRSIHQTPTFVDVSDELSANDHSLSPWSFECSP